MSNHQRANGPSHHDEFQRQRNDHGYSSDHRQPYESERQPIYPPNDHDPQPHSAPRSRRRQNRSAWNERSGYGGGASFRGSPPPVPRGLDPYSPYSLNTSATRGPDHPYRNDPYSDQPCNLVDPPQRPSTVSNNSYTGGCPYTSLHESVPLPNKSRDTSPRGHRDPRSVSGPYKPICNSVSPVKQRSFRPRVKTEMSSFAAPSSSGASAVSTPPDFALRDFKPDALVSSCARNPIALTSNERVQADRRSSRTLSCEREETRSLHRTGLHAPIAHPAAIPTDHKTNAAAHIEQAQENGSLPKTNLESIQTEVRKGKLQTVETIFKKAPLRIPKGPEDELSAVYTPPAINEGDGTANQLIEVAEPMERTSSEKKLPPLRSVPPPIRISKLEDASLIRTGAGAMQVAHQGEYSEMIPNNDCNVLNGNRSPSCATPGVPHDSETRRTISRRQRSRARPNLTSSIANMNIVDRKENGSACEREQGQGCMRQDENQRATSNEDRQGRLLRERNIGLQVSKRRTTDFDGSGETQAKRHRPLPSSEAVNLDDTTALRRSKRFQPFEMTNEKWETVTFDEARVLNLFSEQLRNQPMLLRLSFLGISDGDLRKTVDIWRGEKDLPKPNQRRLEINNNRIRRISGDMCECIAALRVVSLNLSCNFLTTIEGKIGLCSRLKFLDVSRNQLSSLPQELCDLTNLEVLNMSHNDISRLPSGLCRLKHLEVLSLAWNKLEVLPEDVAAEGAVLSDLDLSHNEAFHFFPRCAEHWTKLEVLHLTYTTIYSSLSRRDHRLRPAALVKELAGRKEDMFKSKRSGLRSQSL